MKPKKSLFTGFFGNCPKIRVLDFLIEQDAFDYPKKEICRQADVSWNTLETFWPRLESSGIVARTRKVGKAELYKLNLKHPVVKQLIELDNKLMKQAMDAAAPEREMLKVVARG
ncbi:MAG: hypothetical protein V1676_01305 [Candidatus Diapherotrites archaeon]